MQSARIINDRLIFCVHSFRFPTLLWLLFFTVVTSLSLCKIDLLWLRFILCHVYYLLLRFRSSIYHLRLLCFTFMTHLCLRLSDIDNFLRLRFLYNNLWLWFDIHILRFWLLVNDLRMRSTVSAFVVCFCDIHYLWFLDNLGLLCFTLVTDLFLWLNNVLFLRLNNVLLLRLDNILFLWLDIVMFKSINIITINTI